jgi:LmbE family N-acetylglucosaminyl deacetylase
MPDHLLPEPLHLLAVGAHPDDVEIAVGGTLATLAKQGYRCGIVDLTDGEPTPESPGPEVRLAEARAAAVTLGAVVRETLDLPNRRLFDGYESRVALAKVIRRWRPSIVMGIAGRTPTASPDHWQAMQITDAAVFYSRLTKWDAEFDHLPVHAVRKQLWYPLGFNQLEILKDAGNFFIQDISDTLPAKLDAIRCYKTQFPPHKQRVFALVESMAKVWGMQAGFTAGEVLVPATPLGVRDMVSLLCPSA